MNQAYLMIINIVVDLLFIIAILGLSKLILKCVRVIPAVFLYGFLVSVIVFITSQDFYRNFYSSLDKALALNMSTLINVFTYPYLLLRANFYDLVNTGLKLVTEDTTQLTILVENDFYSMGVSFGLFILNLFIFKKKKVIKINESAYYD